MGAMIKWKREYRDEFVQILIEKLNSAKKQDQNGKSINNPFEFAECAALLDTMLHIPGDFPDIERRRIINRAIINAAMQPTITSGDILKEVSALLHTYLRKELTTYSVFTDISVSSSCVMRPVRYNDALITLHPKLNRTVTKERSRIIKRAAHEINGAVPTNYSHIRVTVKARSPAEAADKALYNLDFVRGVFNFFLNQKNTKRISSGKTRPFNAIILGPIHTVHHNDGSLATDSWFYDPQYRFKIELFNDPQEFCNIINYFGLFRSKIKKLEYRGDIEKALIRYVGALDSPDWQSSFLQLWGILELLTYTARDSHIVTIRRSSILYIDDKYAALCLSQLRDHRNKFVHQGAQPLDIELLMIQAKNFTENLVRFHIGNNFRFRSLNEAAIFLDNANCLQALEQKLENMQKEKRMLAKVRAWRND